MEKENEVKRNKTQYVNDEALHRCKGCCTVLNKIFKVVAKLGKAGRDNMWIAIKFMYVGRKAQVLVTCQFEWDMKWLQV